MEFLVYVDPAARGEWALKAAETLAPALGGDLVLLAGQEDAAADPALLERAVRRLERVRPGVRTLTEPGPAENAVTRACAARRYAMVIVPPAGRTALTRLFKGSRVATIVRQVKSSVLVARRPADRVTSVLVAVAGGKHSPATTLSAIEVAKALGAHVTVIHVRSEVGLPDHLPLHEKRGPSAQVQARERAFEQYDEVKQLLEQAGFEARIHLREGLVVEEILAEIEDGAHDLLVLGAHRAEGQSHWALDDITERILLRSPVPVLVVRAPEPAPG